MKALVACDREAFYASEIEGARARRLSAVRPAGEPDHFRRRPATRRVCPQLAAIAPIDRGSRCWTAEAPLAVIKGRYRFRLLVKSLRSVDLSDYLREWLAAAPKTKGNLQARDRRRSAELL